MPATSIGAYEAKTKLSELLERAHAGEEFLVTKNGRPLARIVPLAGSDVAKRRAAADRAAALSASIAERWAREGIAGPSWEDVKAELDADDEERAARWD